MAKVRIGVIGLGNMGLFHTQYLLEKRIKRAELTAVSDAVPARLAAFSGLQTFTRSEDLVRSGAVDGVIIATPHYFHTTIGIDALQQGLHVLVEKPMAMCVSEAEAMAAAAVRQRRTLAVSVNYRWSLGPDTWYLKNLVARGCLGTVYYARGTSLRRRTFMPGHPTWFTDKRRSGGGGLIDMGPHMLDLAMWLLDDFAPVAVTGVTRTALMTDTDVDDLASALVRMKNGATIALESTWESFTRPGVSVTLLGTRGGAILDLRAPQGERLTLFREEEGVLVETKPVDTRLVGTGEATVQEHFLACVRSGRKPDTAGEHGLAVMRVLDAIYESSASGRSVALGE